MHVFNNSQHLWTTCTAFLAEHSDHLCSFNLPGFEIVFAIMIVITMYWVPLTHIEKKKSMILLANSAHHSLIYEIVMRIRYAYIPNLNEKMILKPLSQFFLFRHSLFIITWLLLLLLLFLFLGLLTGKTQSLGWLNRQKLFGVFGITWGKSGSYKFHPYLGLLYHKT